VIAQLQSAYNGIQVQVAREHGVEDSVLDEALDYRAMAKPHG
jgi:hypothetical protein